MKGTHSSLITKLLLLLALSLMVRGSVNKPKANDNVVIASSSDVAQSGEYYQDQDDSDDDDRDYDSDVMWHRHGVHGEIDRFKSNEEENQIEVNKFEPFFLVVPNKGYDSSEDIVSKPTPNSTVPNGSSNMPPVYQPTTKPPPKEETFDGYVGLLTILLIIFYFLCMILFCSLLSALMMLCGTIIGRNRVAPPRTLQPAVPRMNVPPSRVPGSAVRQQPKRSSKRKPDHVNITIGGTELVAVAYCNLPEEK